MKIKLFYQNYNQNLEDFEKQVNDFMADVKVVDVKYTETTSGSYENMTIVTSVLVMYEYESNDNITKYSETWGIYEEKYKSPQWVNLKTGERYAYQNKERFTDFIKRLKESDNVTDN